MRWRKTKQASAGGGCLGFHAHLGMLYASSADAQTREQFETEAPLPESAPFMNFLMSTRRETQ
jgi:hypothetical protein